MHVYSVVKDPQVGFIFFKDGRQSYCPFVAPFIVPGKIQGGVDVQRMSCNTSCPLCNLVENAEADGSKTVALTIACGAGDCFHGVTIVDKVEEPKSKVLKLS